MPDKIQEYFDSFVKSAIKSKEHLESFLDSVDMKRKFKTEELEKLKSLWGGTSVQKTADKTIDSFTNMSQRVFKDLPIKTKKK
jgi:hypothetical protein